MWAIYYDRGKPQGSQLACRTGCNVKSALKLFIEIGTLFIRYYIRILKIVIKFDLTCFTEAL